MDEETITIRSSVLAEFMKQTLLRGSFLAGVGVTGLLLAGIFLPLPEMEKLGPVIFIFSLGLITLGLLPYKQLKRLEENPYTITIDDQWLHFAKGHKPLFSIPICSIDQIIFINQKNEYGIGIFLKKPLLKKLKLQNSNFDLVGFQERSFKKHQCDLFLSYFSRRSFTSLHEYF